MTQKKRLLSNRQKILFVVLALVVLIGVCATLELTGVTHFILKGSNAAQQDANYNRQKKANTINNHGVPVTDSANSTNKGATTTPYTAPTNSNGISVNAKRDLNNVVITAKLVGYSDGTCNLSIVNGTKDLAQSAQVVYAPDFSSCAGFSVPISSLGNGNWDITVQVTSGGVTTSKNTTFEVQ